MKKFSNKEAALKYCFENLKPNNVGIEEYNRLRQLRARYQKDPSSIKENAIKALFKSFNIQSQCIYYIDES